MKRLFSIFLCCVCILSCCVSVCAEQPVAEAVSAILIERNSGTVLMEQDADAPVYPASLTKIMTSLLVLENCRLTDSVTVSESALEGLDESGSTADLAPGEIFSVEQLLYCILLSSANEACNVAAELVDGSVEDFIAHMNVRASELGCTGTHFSNAHGLHDGEHFTTARDLTRIVQEALKNNTFREIVSTAKYTVPATNLHDARKLTNTNQMILNTESNPYYDSRVTGVKTGFTTPAGRCLIATAEDGTLSLLSVVCGCETRVLESGDLEFASFPETEKLLNYGFDNFTFQTVLTTLYPIAEMPVSRSSGANFVALAPKEELSVLLPSDYDESKIEYDVELISENGVTAPVAAGDELGTVTVRYNGKTLGATALVSIARVERATLFSFLRSDMSGAQKWLRLILLLLIGLAVFALLFIMLVRRGGHGHRRKAGSVRKNAPTAQDLGHSDWFRREDKT